MSAKLDQLVSIVAAVDAMRKLQKRHAKTGDDFALAESKKLEASIDKMLAILLPEDGK